MSTLGKLKNDVRFLFKLMRLFLCAGCSSTSCWAWSFFFFYIFTSHFLRQSFYISRALVEKKARGRVREVGSTTLSSSANLMNLASSHFICETRVMLLEMIISKVQGNIRRGGGGENSCYRNLTENCSRKN